MKKCKGVKGYPCVITQEDQPFTNFYKDGDRLRSYCKKCNSFLRRMRYQEDPSVILKTNKKSYEKNKDSWSEQKRSYAKKHYYENHEQELKRRSDWKKANKHLVASYSAKRRSALLQRTPNWLTEDQYKQIQEVYQHAKDCELVTGEKYHVDHIVPLQGENVSGLHVPWNLQVLPADINIAKSNTYG